MGLAKKIFGKKEFAAEEVLWDTKYFDIWKRFKQDYTQEELKQTLDKGCDVLDKLNITYWLGRGSVLGLHRDGQFLPGDNDIDIDVYGDEKVIDIIREMPFEIYSTCLMEGKYQKIQFFDPETKVLFDIWIYYKKEDKIVYRDQCGVFWFPATILNDLTTIEFQGRAYPSPQPQWFVEFWYGPDWDKPKTYEGHWSITYDKDCSGFEITSWDHTRFIDYSEESN